MSFVNQYRSTTIYGELKVQKYNTGNINGLLDISGNTILRGDCTIDGNLLATDGTLDISGNLSVTNTISGALAINYTNNTNDFFRVPFLDNEASSSTLSSNAGLQYNPVSEQVNYTTLNGGDIFALDISANNVNAANFIGNISTTTEDATNASFFPTFVSAEGNVPLKVNSGITYNPNTETLSVTNINGTILNNASTSTIATDATNASFYPTFVSATSGNLPLKVDTGISYNPSTNILSCDVSGNLTGTASNVNITQVGDNTSFRVPFLSANTGSATISSDAGITYNPSTNLLTTTVSSVNVTAVATDTNFRVPFLSATTGSATISSDGGILYNPLINRLTVGQLEVTSTPLLSSYVGGIWLVSDGTVDVFYPITTSQPDLADVCSQSTLSSYVKQDAGLASAGSYSAVDFNNRINRVIVYPKWGIIAYPNASYGGTPVINYRNSNDFPVSVDVREGTADTMSSCKIYLNSVEQT